MNGGKSWSRVFSGFWNGVRKNTGRAVAPAHCVAWVYSRRDRWLQPAQAHLRRRRSRWAGLGAAGLHAHAHCRPGRPPPPGTLRRPREGGLFCVPLGWGNCGIVADGFGRRSLGSRLQSRETLPLGGRCGGGSGPRVPSTAAQLRGLLGLRRRTSSPTGLDFAAGRWTWDTREAHPLRASAGLETPLTSPSPRSDSCPRRRRPHTQPARRPELWKWALEGPPPPRRLEDACASPGPGRSACALVRPRRPPPPAPTNRAPEQSQSRWRRGGGGAPMSPECEEPPPPRAGKRPLGALPQAGHPEFRAPSLAAPPGVFEYPQPFSLDPSLLSGRLQSGSPSPLDPFSQPPSLFPGRSSPPHLLPCGRTSNRLFSAVPFGLALLQPPFASLLSLCSPTSPYALGLSPTPLPTPTLIFPSSDLSRGHPMLPRSLSPAVDSVASDSHPWAQDDCSGEWGFPSP